MQPNDRVLHISEYSRPHNFVLQNFYLWCPSQFCSIPRFERFEYHLFKKFRVSIEFENTYKLDSTTVLQIKYAFIFTFTKTEQNQVSAKREIPLWIAALPIFLPQNKQKTHESALNLTLSILVHHRTISAWKSTPKGA